MKVGLMELQKDIRITVESRAMIMILQTNYNYNKWVRLGFNSVSIRFLISTAQDRI